MTKYGLSEVTWDTIKTEIRFILMGLAHERQTIYYADLAEQVQTAYIHYRAPAFDRILQNLCADEIAEGRPILGVVVVNRQTGRCGAGFFKWCAAHGCDVTDPEAFWQAEFKRVCDYWAD